MSVRPFLPGGFTRVERVVVERFHRIRSFAPTLRKRGSIVPDKLTDLFVRNIRFPSAP